MYGKLPTRVRQPAGGGVSFVIAGSALALFTTVYPAAAQDKSATRTVTDPPEPQPKIIGNHSTLTCESIGGVPYQQIIEFCRKEVEGLRRREARLELGGEDSSDTISNVKTQIADDLGVIEMFEMKLGKPRWPMRTQPIRQNPAMPQPHAEADELVEYTPAPCRPGRTKCPAG